MNFVSNDICKNPLYPLKIQGPAYDKKHCCYHAGPDVLPRYRRTQKTGPVSFDNPNDRIEGIDQTVFFGDL